MCVVLSCIGQRASYLTAFTYLTLVEHIREKTFFKEVIKTLCEK